MAEGYEDLKAENAKLKDEIAMRKRAQYGKGSEDPNRKRRHLISSAISSGKLLRAGVIMSSLLRRY